MGEAAQAAGRAPTAPRRRLLRGTALLAGAALLTGLLQATGATSSQAAPGLAATAATGSHTAAVTLNDLSPRIPTAGGTITVTGSVVNNGKSKITHARIAVHVPPSGAVRTRSAMESEATRTDFDPALDGSDLNGGQPVDIPTLAPGSSAPFSIKIPVSALYLGAPGVYVLGIALDGENAQETADHVLGIKRTFLPWYGDGQSAKATRISNLWPITDRPHIDPRGDTTSQQSPIFTDDDLVKELKPGGRLSQMVELGRNLPITWVIDPDLLATVEAMTKPYRVAGPGGDVDHPKQGTGSAVAEQWLNSLKSAVSGNQVVALPFGDPDIASIAHNAKGLSSDVSLVKTGAALGKTTVDLILGVQSTTGVAWPADGAVDSSVVSVARASGANQIITRNDSLKEHAALDYTPTSARPIGDGTTAVNTDATLSTAFDGDMSKPQGANLAVQSYLAQTLLITLQAPDTQRTIVVAPQRTPTVSQAKAMARAISAADASQWVEPVDYGTAAKAKADPLANRKVPSSSSYPKSLRKQELPADALQQLHQVQLSLNDFVVILTIKDRVTVPFRNAMLRATSTGWRGDDSGEKAYRNSIGTYLTDLIEAVHILPKSDLTLSGRSGTIPVTVKNELGQPITGLMLRLSSNSNIRLKIKNPEQQIAIDGGHTRTLKFQTTAAANGPAQISAQLYTQSGAVYGSTVAFKVQLTNVTDLVMLIIAAGLLLLVLAGVRIYRQRKRHAASEGGSNGGADGESSGDDDGDGPEHPGDPAARTGQDSTEPSPAGEKVDG
ncbi:hypothetical protein SAMN05216223_105196 [Actinacidiphila yanglinensis]|uniref:Uncharacterized protein n=1 Tax=Actinacidiphila yanglinensis TaxID=310779 RepID=A0A1H6A5T8_9ACTN|nr:DUF6049 family protein [Actinacidiphila yanglinensis]SEG44109.1 hypothetical protein SAMN05216223_105196 [Actinacidiphila yanglinensis]